jgi:DNA invertase Pin-like site-specific DNA recombinase
MKGIVSYVRVSTGQQQRSGLGMEAQRAAIDRFTEANDYHVITEFVEVQSGKGADALRRRPELKAALELARKERCSVIVSKL